MHCTYCSPTCTASYSESCIASDFTLGCSDSNPTSGSGTYYFIPTSVTPSNCGSEGHCCNSFIYPDIVSLFIYNDNDANLFGICPFGVTDTATYGQVFNPPAGAVELNSFVFKINTQSNPILVKAYVATWDRTNFQAISILYASSSFTINTNGYTDVTYTLSTPISVDPSTPYVAFFSTSGIQSGQPSFTSCWVGGPQIVGEEFAFYNNGDDFSLLTTSTWQSFFSGTLLFQAYFNASKKELA